MTLASQKNFNSRELECQELMILPSQSTSRIILYGGMTGSNVSKFIIYLQNSPINKNNNNRKDVCILINVHT